MSVEFAWLKGFNFIWIFLVWSNQFQMNKWNCQSSYELLCLEMPNFDMKFPCISLIGSSKFYMDFPLCKYPISYQHMKFIVWTCTIHWIWCNGLQIISSAPKSFCRLSDPRGYFQARGQNYAAFGGCMCIYIYIYV